jgi:soluble lytic murein transglycosylase-like protein
MEEEITLENNTCIEESGDLQGLGWLIVIVAVIVVVAMGSPAILAKHSQQSTQQTQQAGNYSSDYRSIARQDALDVGISPDLFERQIQQESGFNPDAISSVGAIGIAQFMPTTAAGLGIDPHDPSQALRAASRLMATYTRIYGTYAKALACYNAGCATLDRAMQRCSDYFWCLPTETQNYIVAITGGRP